MMNITCNLKGHKFGAVSLIDGNDILALCERCQQYVLQKTKVTEDYEFKFQGPQPETIDPNIVNVVV